MKKGKKREKPRYLEATSSKMTFTLLQNGNAYFDYEMPGDRDSRTSGAFMFLSLNCRNLFSLALPIEKCPLNNNSRVSNKTYNTYTLIIIDNRRFKIKYRNPRDKVKRKPR